MIIRNAIIERWKIANKRIAIRIKRPKTNLQKNSQKM